MCAWRIPAESWMNDARSSSMHVCFLWHPQLSARYYMAFTGMDQDRVEMNTNRDYFMTPEDAVLEVGVCLAVPSVPKAVWPLLMLMPFNGR